MARNAVASIVGLSRERFDVAMDIATGPGSVTPAMRAFFGIISDRERLPPHPAALGGLGFDVDSDDQAVERAVERRQHATLDEVEGGPLAVARRGQRPGR